MNNNTKSYIPKEGDVVAWSNEQKCTSIAVMISRDDFSVCLNFRGRKDEEDRLWEYDNTPTNRIVRKADKFEMAWLFAELVSQGYEFHAENGKVRVNIEDVYDEIQEEEKQPEFKIECVILTRQDRFAKYIFDLVELFKNQGSLKNMSELSRRNCISSIKKDVFYKVGLGDLKDKEWLRTTEGRSFCNNLYEYALHHTSKYPLIPKEQR